MNLQVDQNNLYLFLPGKISWMAEWLSEDKNISIAEAIEEIYRSELYQNLEKENSKLWHQGPVALYQQLTKV
ncbi:MAG: hypothetical protein IJL54_09190 [Prevotella sp.]|jgi:hypothetical protein|nr:hypothetical protein [Prevotella sp.]